MKYALFSGCRTGFDIPQHTTSAKAVLSRLNVKVEELDFGCCEYPVKEKIWMHFFCCPYGIWPWPRRITCMY